MQLAVGERLGHYEIIAELGAGGMGVVYRAHDPRVRRDVAIKVSIERFSDRFEREARAVAALNHPNICTLYDVGPNYLVMELVEGEALTGPLPLHTALDYARQIALALDAAHEKGIVHRDLKPGNIRIRSDGTVKVLDFGLAKITAEDAPAQDPENSPTIAMNRTQAGLILGTAAYMAPEQARGKPVDKRADIWAFGVVLYEMLTGRPAFQGEDVSTVLAAVLQSEPRLESVPASVRRLLESCLEKDPRKRLRDIGDAWKLLDEAPKPSVSSSWSGRAGWMAAAALAGLAALSLWAPWRTTPRDAAPPLIRLDVELGPDVTLVPLVAPTFSSLVISPDGTQLVFVGSVAGGPTRLFVRRLDAVTNTELPGTQGATNPFFSPDGQWVAFWTDQKLAKVSLGGGAVVPLADLGTMTGGSWSDDGYLVVGSGLPGTAGLLRIAADGGEPAPIVDLASGELFHTFPHVIPGHDAVLMAAVGTPPRLETTNIDIVSLEDGRRKTLVRGGTSPRYLPSGHVVYATGAGMFAVPFDIDSWETRGAAVAIFDDAILDPLTGGAQFDVSGGTLVYRKNPGGLVDTPKHVLWLDGTDTQEPLLGRPGAYVGTPRLSGDGRLAITIRDGADQDIWVYHPQRDTMTRLTFGGRTYSHPVWSPEGRFVIFSSLGGGLMWARADGAGQPQVLASSGSNHLQFPTSLTPDGKRLAFEDVVDGRPQIWSVELAEEEAGLQAGEPTRFLTTPSQDGAAAFSPDGRWIAYHSNESGRFEVYVRPFSTSSSASDDRVLISNDGGGLPVWLPQGGELLYLAGGQIMAVGYTTPGTSFLADRPRSWAASVSDVAGFDVAPDGTRLAIVAPTVTRAAPRQDHIIVFVQDILDELQRRAPAAR